VVSKDYFFVPPPPMTVSQIGFTGSTTISTTMPGVPVTAKITTAGTSALVAFDGTAGQPVSLNITVDGVIFHGPKVDRANIDSSIRRDESKNRLTLSKEKRNEALIEFVPVTALLRDSERYRSASTGGPTHN